MIERPPQLALNFESANLSPPLKGDDLDVLSDILDAVRLKGTLYFRTEFSPPWAVRVPQFSNVARFHLAVRGSCFVEVEGEARPIQLNAGDLVVIPGGRAHVLADSLGRDPVAVDEVVQRSGFRGAGALVYGGEDRAAPTRLICGHFAFAEYGGRLLLSALPRVIEVRRGESLGDALLSEGMKFITAEASAGAPGGAAIVNRLAEILFIRAIRQVAATQGAGILAGVRDGQIGKAIGAIHREPEKAWTVDELAREAGLSRTVFAERMRELVGVAPMQYLTEWRMECALRRLSESALPIAEIAKRAGYNSDASFNRAFKRHFGVGPGKFHRP